MTQICADGGATSLVDVRQAEQLVFAARGQIVDLRRRVKQQENALSYLIGGGPGPIDRGQLLTEQAHAPEVPEGLPSTLLERRPDIQQAEQLLVAADAQIGVAKASYFPQIHLTGAGGVASSALSSLFKTGAWAFGATVVQPVFNTGRNRSRVKLADARRQEAELVYQQKTQQSFRDETQDRTDAHGPHPVKEASRPSAARSRIPIEVRFEAYGLEAEETKEEGIRD